MKPKRKTAAAERDYAAEADTLSDAIDSGVEEILRDAGRGLAGIDGRLEEIAQHELGGITLTERGRDSLDFHDLSVATLRRALEAAYEAGVLEAVAQIYQKQNKERG